jgi:hypothetical protein
VGKYRKAWVITRGTDRQRITVGHYPAMSLADARKEARKLLTEPVARHSGMKFEAAYELFKQDHIAGKKPRTQCDYKRMIEKHLLLKFGNKRLADVSYEDVTAITDKLPTSERAHCLAVGRTFFRWCVQPPRRYIPHSPLEGVKVKTGNRRKRVLKQDELTRVWTAAETEGYPYGTIVQLLASTGQRRGEIANLRWTWIDEKERIIVDCFRNSTKLEDMHTADQIDDQEMQDLMIDVVDRCYDFLMELCSPHGVEIIEDLKQRDKVPNWNDPRPMIFRHL